MTRTNTRGARKKNVERGGEYRAIGGGGQGGRRMAAPQRPGTARFTAPAPAGGPRAAPPVCQYHTGRRQPGTVALASDLDAPARCPWPRPGAAHSMRSASAQDFMSRDSGDGGRLGSPLPAGWCVRGRPIRCTESRPLRYRYDEQRCCLPALWHAPPPRQACHLRA